MGKLKDIWKQQDLSDQNIRREDLKKLLSKKSKSIAKWILIISIVEFVIPHVIYLFTDKTTIQEQYNLIGIQNFMYFTNLTTYVVGAVFVYYFYQNYKKIKIEQSVAQLIDRIVKTRKVVKNYIYYNLIALSFIYLVYIVKVFSNYDIMRSYFNLDATVNIEEIWLPYLITSILFIALIVFLLWLFYRVTYGYLLRRLLENYKDIKN